MSQGAVLQLASYGAQDLYLTGNPQITHFVSVIKRNTNFAIETIENYFDGKLAPGQKITSTLKRSGDLISQMYLLIELPALQTIQGEDDVYTSWVNAIGFAMIEHVSVRIGDQIIDKQYGQWMYIWSELTTDLSRRDGLDALVGNNRFFNATTQNGPLRLYIPLYFWFCRDSGSALPLVALQNQNVQIEVQFKNMDSLWISNNRPVARERVNDDTVFTQATLLVDYIFLDTDERRFFAQNKHMYLIQQTQTSTESVDTTQERAVIDLPFNHPVKELYWVIQGDRVRAAREWFNFTGDINVDEDSRFPGEPRAPIQDAIILFNGVERFEVRKEDYFRIVQPWQHHTRVPRDFIYVYSFALKPELLQPSGTANFSRLDNATLHINTSNFLGKSQVTVYGMSYNIFRTASGLGGLLFHN